MIRLTIYNRNQHWQSTLGAGRIQLSQAKSVPCDHFVAVKDTFGAPQNLIVEYKKNQNSIRIENFGGVVVLDSGLRIFRGQQRSFKLPIRISIGETVVEFANAAKSRKIDQFITRLNFNADSISIDRDLHANERAPSTSKLALWFESISRLQKTVAGSQAFFLEAAKSVYDPGGLDMAMVICRKTCEWEIAASFVSNPELGIGFQQDIVDRVFETGETHFHDAEKVKVLNTGDETDGVVAAPVLDRQQEVVAVVYAVRSRHRSNHRIGIRAMEAQFVHLVAESVSAGLIRLDMESKAAQSRALLEQAFAPEVAQRLQRDPSILNARDEEVTVMFADLRGFTTIAERVGTELTYQLLADVMDRFTQLIMKHAGVVVDYFGDGLAAFWNAPIEQVDHSSLACKAAHEMLDEVPNLNQQWSARLGQSLSVGIGIHTGIAQVGNSGSRRRLKYGPRGNTVNLAERIESATKTIGLPLLISGATADQLSGDFAKRRIVRTQVPGINKAVELFQPILKTRLHPSQQNLIETYEHALNAFENRDFAKAIHELVNLEADNQADGAVEYLLKEISRHQGSAGKFVSPKSTAAGLRPLLSGDKISFTEQAAP